jgi:hypothetical protein
VHAPRAHMPHRCPCAGAAACTIACHACRLYPSSTGPLQCTCLGPTCPHCCPCVGAAACTSACHAYRLYPPTTGLLQKKYRCVPRLKIDDPKGMVACKWFDLEMQGGGTEKNGGELGFDWDFECTLTVTNSQLNCRLLKQLW